MLLGEGYLSGRTALTLFVRASWLAMAGGIAAFAGAGLYFARHPALNRPPSFGANMRPSTLQPEPRTARAALFHGPGQPFEIVTAKVPAPIAGEVLVDVECCAICSSDLHTWAGRRSEPTPIVLGHEVVGRIRAMGPSVPPDARGEPLAIGDRVTWTITAGCGCCRACVDDLPQKCAHLVKYGHARVNDAMPFRGGLADVMLLAPGTTLVKIPVGMPLATAALANCGVATVAAALRVAFDRRPAAPSPSSAPASWDSSPARWRGPSTAHRS